MQLKISTREYSWNEDSCQQDFILDLWIYISTGPLVVRRLPLIKAKSKSKETCPYLIQYTPDSIESDDTTGNCPIKKYILIDKTIMT